LANLNILKLELVKHFGFQDFVLFCSTASDEAAENSDVDILA
jgi:predicted nucleotidyltransferase